MKSGFTRVTTVAVAALLVTGCAAMRAHKGSVLDSQLVTSIQPGVDNQASVEKLLGRPTFVGQFARNQWIYVARDTTQLAFRNPRVTRQSTLIVNFDAAGNVTSVQQSGKELAMNLEPSGRKTPTMGKKKSFFEELFGNIGSVNSGGIPGQ